ESIKIEYRAGIMALPLPSFLRHFLRKDLYQIDGKGEDDGRALLRRDLHQGRQVAELEGHGVQGEDVGGLMELGRRLELTLGADDLRPPLTLGLSLARDGALHLLGQVHVLYLHVRHLDAPRLGVQVEYLLEALVDLLPVGEELVELGLAEDAPERGLGELARGIEVVLHVDDGLHGVYNPEVDDGVHLDGDVVLRDHVLGGHVVDHGPEGHLDHPVDDGYEDDEARPLGLAQHAAEAKDYPTLVFVQYLDRHGQKD